MLIKQELIKKVRDYFNLNIYETKVWLALLGKGIATAGEVAAISGVPRSRTYDVLESLEKRGFAIAKLDKPVRFIGVKPKVILEKLKNNVRSEAEEKIVDLSKVKETEEFTKIESLYKLGMAPVKKEDISASLRGKSNITNHLKEILQNAGKEVIMCANVKDIASKAKLFSQTFENLRKANVKTKVALSGDSKLIKEMSGKFQMNFKKININAKFFIIDRKEILFYLSEDANGEEIAIWLNSQFFSEAFATLFDNVLGRER